MEKSCGKNQRVEYKILIGNCLEAVCPVLSAGQVHIIHQLDKGIITKVLVARTWSGYQNCKPLLCAVLKKCLSFSSLESFHRWARLQASCVELTGVMRSVTGWRRWPCSSSISKLAPALRGCHQQEDLLAHFIVSIPMYILLHTLLTLSTFYCTLCCHSTYLVESAVS